MSDSVLNEEIARLEIEIDAVRDALDEAVKRNEELEQAGDYLMRRHAEQADEIERLKAALTEARDDLDDRGSIPDGERQRMRDRLTLALASLEPKSDPDHPSWNELIEDPEEEPKP